jgi:hypothetical protein
MKLDGFSSRDGSDRDGFDREIPRTASNAVRNSAQCWASTSRVPKASLQVNEVFQVLANWLNWIEVVVQHSPTCFSIGGFDR